MMDIFFADDAKQKNPTRQGIKTLLGAGGFRVPSESSQALEKAQKKLCADVGIPKDEKFKWSPGPELWMDFYHGGLATVDRTVRLYVDNVVIARSYIGPLGTGAAGSPQIATSPENKTVTEGQMATFSVGATGTAPLSYQWQRNGSNIAGTTDSSYTTPPVALADSGSTFRVVVSNSAGSTTSPSGTLTVIPLGAAGDPPSEGGGHGGRCGALGIEVLLGVVAGLPARHVRSAMRQ